MKDLSELEQLRRENIALNDIVDRLIDFNKKEKNSNIDGILKLLNVQLQISDNSNKFILNQVEKLLLDIEAMINQNFNFKPIIIMNRKNIKCYGVYIKNKKEIGIGVGINSTSALEDLKYKCRKYIKEFNK